MQASNNKYLCNEDQLLKGCIEGDEKYMEILFNRYYSAMYHVCRRYSAHNEEAKDMVHEGFIQIFSNIQQFQGQGSFEGWIRKIMINNAINCYHKESRNRLVENINDEYVMNKVNVTMNEYQEAEENLSVNELLEIINKLPDSYRMVFNLFVIDGYSHKEISEIMGITESTSRSNLTKARIKLQQELINQMQNIKIINE